MLPIFDRIKTEIDVTPELRNYPKSLMLTIPLFAYLGDGTVHRVGFSNVSHNRVLGSERAFSNEEPPKA